MYWLTDCLPERLTDWPTGWWLTDWLAAYWHWLTDRLIDWLSYWLMTDWHSEWLTDWLTVLLADDWLAGWITDWHSECLTYWLTCWLTDCLAGLLTDWHDGPTFWMMTDGLFETIMDRLVDCCWPGLQTGWPSDYWVPRGFFSLFSNNEMVEELITSTDVPIVTQWLMKIDLYGPVEKNIILIS